MNNCKLLMLGVAAAIAIRAAAGVTVTNTSNPFIVWNTLPPNNCTQLPPGPNDKLDVPDTPPNAFVDSKGLVHLFSADTTTRGSLGTSLFNTKRNCTVVLNSTSSPDPSMYATNEFIDATYAFDNGTVYALLHVEYPGNVYKNCPPGKTYPQCWTVSMTLAVSHDWGYSWQHARSPPNHMVAAPPFKYSGSVALNSGWGDSSGIMKSPTDGYFYAIVHNRFQEGTQSNGSCVIRTNDISDPKSWRGWGGEKAGFAVKFLSPYDTPGYNPEDHVCTVLDIPDCVAMGLVYSTYLEEYVASLSCGDLNGGDSGIEFFFITSSDMVKWSSPQRLFTAPVPPGVHFYSYPTIRDANAPSRGDRNFETIGQTATLMYVSVTHNFFTQGRQIYGVNITFTK